MCKKNSDNTVKANSRSDVDNNYFGVVKCPIVVT